MAFEDVALYFSAEEWALLARWQRELYQEVMMDNYDLVACLGKEQCCTAPPSAPGPSCAPAPTASRFAATTGGGTAASCTWQSRGTAVPSWHLMSTSVVVTPPGRIPRVSVTPLRAALGSG